MNVFLWGVFPYVCLTLMVVGLVWRYNSDQYGWTSESSQLRESRILRWSSPMFHLGILAVAVGHVMGLVIPKEATEAIGVTQHQYHLLATIGGGLAAVVTLVGFFGLVYRRFVKRSVRFANTKRDRVVYVLLTIPLLLGAFATASNQIFGPEGGYNYRETISVWFRSIFFFQPNVEVMAGVPLSFQLHIVAALLLFAIWPFTRLVHVFSAPVGYVTRPPIVYRSRKPSTSATSAYPGWTPVEETKAGGVRGEDLSAPAHGA
ncbi:respiratory nitrate reductase subunit gamma [Gleimia hominis]|uniref:Respiratory nitrate reductase subunit gamma n=1 Tax=Gleimia hominis TaxID=595468 RepID=A0ABU3I969_9ACTO|nr:respiratory nitrate reductase subunit gamma [Gleimia hominis]MDT3766913.1 respiratory nitrate reductase subunit gamma [Gleimia hominis]